MPMEPHDGVEAVRMFLRAQNLEQVGRDEEAVELYEAVTAARFDSSGPYDRLIHIYADRSQHADVIRIAEAALQNVQTYPDKRGWYELMRAQALRAGSELPQAAPRRPRPNP